MPCAAPSARKARQGTSANTSRPSATSSRSSLLRILQRCVGSSPCPHTPRPSSHTSSIHDGQDGAFDTHAADVDAIAHTASPVRPSEGDPSEVIHPAVEGTRSVLASALLHCARVRRVLVLSSAVALSLETQADRTVVLDESSWNEFSVVRCEEKGRDAEPMHKYCASKVLAERAAWDFYEGAKKELSEKGETLGWDLAVFCSPFVFGPMIHDVPSMEMFGRTPADWYKRVVKGETDGPGARQPANFGYVSRPFLQAGLD